MAQRTIINGSFQDALGNPLNAGYFTMRLSTDAVAGTSQIVAGLMTTTNLDASGNVLGTVNVWPNDQMMPSTTVYIVRVYSANGQLAWQGKQTIPSGAGSFDLNSWIPTP